MLLSGKSDFFSAHKRYLLLPLDLILTALSYFTAGLLRFDSVYPHEWTGFQNYDEFLFITGVLVSIRLSVFILMGLYKSVWKYASLHDIFLILKATIISSLSFITFLIFYNRLEGISRSVLVLDWILVFMLLSFRSFSWRIFRDLMFPGSLRKGEPTLIIGAGETGNRLAREILANPSYNMNPVGFLDKDRKNFKASIQGLPVLGGLDELENICERFKLKNVIIASELKSSPVRDIYRICEERHIHCKTLPALPNLLQKPEISGTLRDINIEDLLGREVVRLETEGIRKILTGKNILVTGAGGSIGSEVVRQLLIYNPSSLVLFDQAETPLYEIDYELRHSQNSYSGRIETIIGDVRNKETLVKTLRSQNINVVFHCAAYKHVPMMEINPGEAIMNNVFGTMNLADAAKDCGIERFVMISTDKAVNPVNIMGATKRLAEIYIQNLARTTETKYITVRFGNVLGSNGSVIPLFKKQIEKGGPVTVTHPDIIRYFMTIPEAAGLVIQAGAMGQEGEIFILDMGDPVKIRDLAEDMIRLTGLIPGKDIEIRYVGLRPGEKLYEELLLSEEGIQPTRHEKIYIALSSQIDLASFLESLDLLKNAALQNSKENINKIIRGIIPEYLPMAKKDSE